LEPFGEERTDGAVDDPAAQDLVVARPAFALDEATWNLAGGVRLLLVLDREWEERKWALVVAHRDGRQDHRIAEGDQAGAGGLFGHASGLDDQLASRERLFNALHFVLSPLPACGPMPYAPRGMQN